MSNGEKELLELLGREGVKAANSKTGGRARLGGGVGPVRRSDTELSF